MSADAIHVCFLFLVAVLTGHQVNEGEYGWAATFALIFFAMLAN